MNTTLRATLALLGLVLLAGVRTAAAATLTLSWTPNGESDIAGYIVSYGTTAQAYTVSTDVATRTSLQLTTLASGTTYYFVVKAYNTAGALSPASPELAGTTPASTPGSTPPGDTTPPTAPTALRVTPGAAGTLALTWTAATDNVAVTAYLLERCQGAACTAFVPVATTPATRVSDPGLTAALRYRYRVRATDAAGNRSAYSAVVGATTAAAAAPPPPPARLMATATAKTRITLTWTASPSAGVTGYLVERCQWTGCTDFAPVGTAAAASFADAALAAGINYSYRVRAVDAANLLSVYSAVATVATLGGNSALVAAYAFDEGAGPTAGDSSLAGNSGTLVNATWTSAGNAGGALAFDGRGAQVTVPDAASLHLTTAMTLEAWVNPADALTPDWHAFLYKGLDTYALASYPSGVPLGVATVGDTLALPTAAAALPVHTWTHLATTYNGTMVRLYVNGVLVSSVPATGALAVSTNPLEIGASLTDGGAFAGLLDDVRVYSVARTAAQIRTDMATPVVGR